MSGLYALRITPYMIVVLSGFYFVGCGGNGNGEIATEVIEVLPTMVTTAVPITIPPTKTEIPPTETASPTATATLTPTSIPSPTPLPDLNADSLSNSR